MVDKQDGDTVEAAVARLIEIDRNRKCALACAAILEHRAVLILSTPERLDGSNGPDPYPFRSCR
jgi:hypothetical protein